MRFRPLTKWRRLLCRKRIGREDVFIRMDLKRSDHVSSKTETAHERGGVAMKNVIVVGAGASGLMAAYTAAKNGNRVVVLEKNEKAGKKLYITGKGRCNLTNDIPPQDFLQNVVTNAKFLTGCIHKFPPSALMEMLEEGGLPLKVERGGRVFPLSDKASDVTACLLRYCQKEGVIFHFGEKVVKIEVIDSIMSGIITDKTRYDADCAVVCTGGASYPLTGSTGDGLVFARQCGLETVPFRAALCGIVCRMDGLSELQGLSLKNVRVSACVGDRCVSSFFGEMLFTHFGISGPCVLSMSSEINKTDMRSLKIYIDLKPALDADTLDKRVLRDFSKYANKRLKNALTDLLPQKLILPVIEASGCDAETPVNSLTRESRAALVGTLKAFPLLPVSLRPVEEGIVTAGGVNVREIDPKTMESKKIKGLYFCGETLDVDAYTGGFNLQIAFSTGYAAGSSIF